MQRKLLISLILVALTLTACLPQQVSEDPGLLLTVVASTQTAAAWQTQWAEASFSKTPTQATLRPTFTPFPTMTPFVYLLTASPTATYSPVPTSTPSTLSGWPDWKSGSVISMPRGSGANIGTNKYFSILDGVEVLIVRGRGVKLRDVPNKAQDGPMEEAGAALTLTGVMNKNKEYGWYFAQVKAINGKLYWVGGSEGEDTDPQICFEFYYPHLTTSPTPTVTETFTPRPTSLPSGTPTSTSTKTQTPIP